MGIAVKTTWITIYHHELILTGNALFVIGLELTGLTGHEVERCEDEALEQGHSMIHVRLRLGLVCSLSRKNHAEMGVWGGTSMLQVSYGRIVLA